MKAPHASLLTIAIGCSSESISGDFTGFTLETSFATRLGIDRLVIAGTADDGSEALSPKPFMLEGVAAGETRTETANLILRGDLDGKIVTLTVDGAKEAGVVASGKVSRRMSAGFLVTSTVALSVVTTCGDGRVDPAEDCDDGDAREGDGCAPTCTIDPGFVCIGQPSECFVESRTAVVDDGARCPGQGTGASPFCALSSGVAAPWAFTVAVAAGVYGERVVVDRDLEIVGAAGARLAVGAVPAVRIEEGSVTIRGFEIAGDTGIGGGIEATGPDTMVEIIGNDIGPGSSVGIRIGSGAFARIEKNRIHEHAGGGLELDTDIGFIVRNNIVIDNGTASSELGGVRIGRGPPNSVFSNNTVVMSRSATSSTAGIECVPEAAVTNSILWDQAAVPACAITFSDVGPITSTVAIGEGVFSAPPLLTDDGHLKSGSPCVDAGDPRSIAEGVAPIEDIDGESRPKGGAIDVGADELE